MNLAEMNKCKRMLCLQSFYYIRIRTSGTSVLKEALAITLPSRIKSFARKYASRSSRSSSSVSKCESHLCCTRKSRLSFPCFNGFFLALWTLIPLVILLTVCHTVLVMLVWRIWYGKTCCW